MNINDALSNAGIDSDAISYTPDGVWTVTREDGSRISFGTAGDGFDFTVYAADDEIEAQDWLSTAEQMAARVAQFLNA